MREVKPMDMGKYRGGVPTWWRLLIRNRTSLQWLPVLATVVTEDARQVQRLRHANRLTTERYSQNNTTIVQLQRRPSERGCMWRQPQLIGPLTSCQLGRCRLLLSPETPDPFDYRPKSEQNLGSGEKLAFWCRTYSVKPVTDQLCAVVHHNCAHHMHTYIMSSSYTVTGSGFDLAWLSCLLSASVSSAYFVLLCRKNILHPFLYLF